MHSAGVREHRGEHQVDGQEPSSIASLAEPTRTQNPQKTNLRFYGPFGH